jgi:hypothetical protein
LQEEEIDESMQPKDVIGESEGPDVSLNVRIPDAAGHYSAIYFDVGKRTSGPITSETDG